MRSHLTLVAAVALYPLLSPAHGPKNTPPADAGTPTAPASGPEAEVASTVRALFAAAERGDLAALDGIYAGDRLTVVEGTGIDRTWAAYRDHHLAPELKAFKNFKYRPYDIEAKVSGSFAYAIFAYALQADAKGKAVDVVGRGTAVLERRANGGWTIVHTQTTSRPRRPTDPAMPASAP